MNIRSLVIAVFTAPIFVFAVNAHDGGLFDPQFDRSVTPLMKAVFFNSIEDVKTLLKNGVDPKEKDKNGFTAFLSSVFDSSSIAYGTFSHRLKFLCKGVCKEERRQKHYDQLFLLINENVEKNEEIMNILMEHEEDLDIFEKVQIYVMDNMDVEEDSTPSHTIDSNSGTIPQIKWEYRDEKPSTEYYEGTPLMFSILYKHRVLSYLFSLIEYLEEPCRKIDLEKIIEATNKIKLALNRRINTIAKNCTNINVQSRGKSALLLAIELRDVEAIKILIKNGANPNFTFEEDEITLLIGLASDEFVDEEVLDLIEFILENGAKPHITDKYGRSAYDYAKNQQVRELLLRYKDMGSTKKENLALSEINITVSNKNLDKFIGQYSSNDKIEGPPSVLFEPKMNLGFY